MACLVTALTSGARAQESDADPGMSSPGMVAGGIAMMVVGTPATAFGALLVVFSANNHVDCVTGPCEQPDTTAPRVGGAAMIVGGLGLIGGGVAMVVIGAEDEESSTSSAQVTVTPTGAVLRGTF